MYNERKSATVSTFSEQLTERMNKTQDSVFCRLTFLNDNILFDWIQTEQKRQNKRKTLNSFRLNQSLMRYIQIYLQNYIFHKTKKCRFY